MPPSEHVPWPDDSNVHAAAAEHGLALRAHGDVTLHDRRGLGDAQINEVLNSIFLCRFNRAQRGRAINSLKFGGFPGIRM